MLVGVFPISKITAGTAHCTDSSCNGCTAQVRRILMEHFIEFRIFEFTVFIAVNQLFDIALLFQSSGSYASYSIPIVVDNTNQVGECFLIYTNRIIKADTASDSSYLIAGSNLQSAHLLYNDILLCCYYSTNTISCKGCYNLKNNPKREDYMQPIIKTNA